MLKLSQRMFLTALGTVVLGGACGGDDTVPLEPASYALSIERVNDASGGDIALRCDRTLSVLVSISSADTFSLRPANACGTSTRCGYVHFELLENERVVASADSATLEGVLRLPEVLAEGPHEIVASLRSGVDGATIVNANGEPALTSLTATFTPPVSCEPAGGGGAGGAPSEPSAGAGPGGASPGGAGGADGADGEAEGGAAGQPTTPEGGGGAAGEPTNAGAGGA